ncbi:MAG TPA: dTDP-glucose 4,6-dehydratase [Gemmatimonadaceae bacterium]|nr:dTDP-glucose 4,6-dehydratase [Gemmatimonadaceae bacterium]
MRHILVTGGAGFIGSHFVRHAARGATNARVTVLDALTYAGDLRRIADVASAITFVQGDICDRALLDSLLAADDASGVDAVVHFAAETHVDRSLADPAPFLRTNIAGTQTILEAIRARGALGPRLLHVSTDEVYGDLAAGDAPFTERSPLAPSSPYSASKAAGDSLVLAWVRSYGLRATIVRGANNYGPFQYPEKLIPVVIEHALAGRSIPLYGDGLQRRAWIHVEDYVGALWTLLGADRPRHTVYNIPSEPDITNREVAEIVLDALSLPRTRIASVADRAGHDRRYAIDGTRFLEEFGWTLRHNMRESLPKVVAWEAHRRAAAG